MFWNRTQPAAAEETSALAPEQHAARILAWIDAFMVRVCGYADLAERTDEHGRRHFRRGSATGMAWVAVDDEGDERECAFHCAAHVMDLPSDGDLLLPLYRELLELNWELVGVPRLAVLKNQVWALYSERASMLTNAVQVAVAIDHVMGLTDAIDDGLIRRYGGTSSKIPVGE